MKLNISIDDICPHPNSSIKVLDRCYEILNVFPDIKFTLFIPLSYTRLHEPSYFVSHDVSFCKVIAELPSENFELGWHGYYHGIRGVSNNDEFETLSYDACVGVLKNMFNESKIAGLYDLFKPILRPSAFRMSPDSFKACFDNGIELLALSEEREYYGADKLGKLQVVYYNVNPPFKPLKPFQYTEIVYHAFEGDQNYLDQTKTLDLIQFLDTNQFEYVFLQKLQPYVNKLYNNYEEK